GNRKEVILHTAPATSALKVSSKKAHHPVPRHFPGFRFKTVPLPGIVVDFGVTSCLAQSCLKAPRRFDRPGLIGLAMAEKKRSPIALDLDRHRRQKRLGRASPPPGAF